LDLWQVHAADQNPGIRVTPNSDGNASGLLQIIDKILGRKSIVFRLWVGKDDSSTRP
jgi:hypothetical protein